MEKCLVSLNSLFAPKSVAVVGASRRNGTLGKMFLDALVGMTTPQADTALSPKVRRAATSTLIAVLITVSS